MTSLQTHSRTFSFDVFLDLSSIYFSISKLCMLIQQKQHVNVNEMKSAKLLLNHFLIAFCRLLKSKNKKDSALYSLRHFHSFHSHHSIEYPSTHSSLSCCSASAAAAAYFEHKHKVKDAYFHLDFNLGDDHCERVIKGKFKDVQSLASSFC